MRQAWLWLGLIMLLLLPSQGLAQHDHRESSRGLNGAVEKLFEHRAELGMTETQLARVQEIRDSADVLKRPLWQEIMSVRRDVKARRKAEPKMPEAEESALLRRSGEHIERLLDEIRRIDHAAMRQVGDVLSDQQKDRIREMVSKSRGGRDRSDDDRGREGSRD